MLDGSWISNAEGSGLLSITRFLAISCWVSLGLCFRLRRMTLCDELRRRRGILVAETSVDTLELCPWLRVVLLTIEGVVAVACCDGTSGYDGFASNSSRSCCRSVSRRGSVSPCDCVEFACIAVKLKAGL